MYADYFDELQRVNNVIVYYHRVKDITAMQVGTVQEYRRAFDLGAIIDAYCRNRFLRPYRNTCNSGSIGEENRTIITYPVFDMLAIQVFMQYRANKKRL